MPTYKISQLTTATAVSATNQFEINQNGTSKSVEVSVIDAYIKSTSSLPVVVSVSSATDALRITQTGTGNALVVEDSANPDATPFVVDASGNVGIGTSSPASKLSVSSASSVQIQATTGTVDFRIQSIDANAAAYSGTVSNHAYAFTTNNSERMRIDASGNVGIGTSSPGTRLDVAGGVIRNSIAAAGLLQVATESANSITYQVGSDGSALYVGTNSNHALRFTTNNAERMRIDASGEVYIAGTTDQGAYNLQVNGTGVWGAGAYVNGSDARIKHDIAPLASGLDVVAQLKPVQFRYKESWSKDTALQPGFIAQDLQEALGDQPYVEGVVLQGPEYMSVAYQALIPLLTKAIQELKAEFDAYKAAHP